MKRSINGLTLLLAAGMFVASCGDNSKSTTTDTSDTLSANDKMTTTTEPVTTAPSADQDFINTVVTANTKEIAWMYAGIDKGSTKELQDHARMMLTDHKKMEADVKGLVTSKNWTAPTVDTTNEVTINDKKGKAFDKAWSEKMVQDHVNLIANLKKGQTDVKDEELRTLITKSIPVVQGHLDMVKKMNDKMK